jgi:hypothetical protein
MRKPRSKRARSSADIIDPKAPVDKLASRTRLLVRIVAGGLALLFGWLQFKDYLIGSMFANVQPELLRKATLAIYYLCWVFGANFEIGIQQEVYVKDPDRGRVPLHALGAIIGFGIVASILLWAADNDQRFAAALTCFVAANIAGWRGIYVRRVMPIIRASEKYYTTEKEDFAELERVRVVSEYMAGAWQWHRFIVLSIIIGIVDLIAFAEVVRQNLEATIRMALRDWPSGLLPDASLIVFVVVSETWIWIKRGQTRAFLNAIFELKQKYVLKPRTKAE